MTAYLHCTPCLIHMALCLLTMWCTLCRLNYMSRQTPHVVTLGYFVMGALASLLLFVRTEVWVFAVLVFMLGWFLLTSKNWNNCHRIRA